MQESCARRRSRAPSPPRCSARRTPCTTSARIRARTSNVLKTLENVILLITQTLQQLNATPAVRLIDEPMTLDPVAEADAVRERMDAAFDDGRVGKDDLTASLTMMLDGMSEQDEAWEKHAAAASQTTDKEEFEQLLAHANGRMEAKRRLTQLKAMCE